VTETLRRADIEGLNRIAKALEAAAGEAMALATANEERDGGQLVYDLAINIGSTATLILTAMDRTVGVAGQTAGKSN
jgi:hypothetical protein